MASGSKECTLLLLAEKKQRKPGPSHVVKDMEIFAFASGESGYHVY